MQAGVIVCRSFCVMLQSFQIREGGLADRAAVIFFCCLLFLDGVGVLMKPKIRQSIKHFAAHVATILRSLVTASVLQEILELGKHHATTTLHAFVHFQRQMRDYEVAL